MVGYLKGKTIPQFSNQTEVEGVTQCLCSVASGQETKPICYHIMNTEMHCALVMKQIYFINAVRAKQIVLFRPW